MTTQLHLVAGTDLPPPGWQHTTPFDLTRVAPVANDWAKPKGGLWTAPLREHSTAWTEWCTDENFGDPAAPITLVIPDPAARVYVIDNHADLLALEDAHRDPMQTKPVGMWPAIDWEAAARDIDAVWLTDDGQWATRFSQPGLYGWDLETVFWLNPRISEGDSNG